MKFMMHGRPHVGGIQLWLEYKGLWDTRRVDKGLWDMYVEWIKPQYCLAITWTMTTNGDKIIIGSDYVLSGYNCKQCMFCCHLDIIRRWHDYR